MAVNLISSEEIGITQTGSDIQLDLTGKTGDLVVDSIRTKNIASDTTLKNGLWSGTSSFSANAYGWYVVEEIKGGETYTISKKNNNSISGITLVVGTSATYPASGVSVIDGFITNINDQTQYTLTIQHVYRHP